MQRFGLLALLAVAVIAVACAAENNRSASKPATDVQRLTVVVGDSVRFDPADLRVQAGKPVELTVRNTGNTDHDLIIPVLPAKDVVSERGGHSHPPAAVIAHPGKKGEVTVRFTPTTPGIYDLWCSLPGHRDLGMTGRLMVV